MKLLDLLGYQLGAAFLRASGVKRPDWPAWMLNLEQFMLSDENLQAMQAYASVPDVYTCVSLLQDFIAALPLDFYEGRGDRRVKLDPDVDGTPGFLWKQANERQTGYDLIHDVVGHLLLGGNSYLMMEFERPASDPTIISTLWNLPSQNTAPVLAKGRGIAHFTYMQDGITPQRIPERQVVHVSDFNPDDTGKGLSRVEVLRLIWQRQRNMDRFEHEFYKRGGTAAGLYTSDKPLMPPQHRQLKHDIDTVVSGPENYGRPILLPNGVKYERAGMTHAEMQFIETGSMTLGVLLRAFKVPPILVGVKSAGLGASDKGGQNDMLLFIEHGVRPITRRLTAKFNEVLLRPSLWKGRELSCEFDYSGVLALQEVFLAQAQAYATATGHPVMTVNEARMRLQLAKSDEPEADLLFQKSTVPDDSEAGNKPPFGKDEEPPTGKDKETDESAIAKEGHSIDVLLRDLMRADAMAKQERYIERTRRVALRRFRNQQKRIVDVLLDEQRDAAFDLDSGSLLVDEQRAVNLDVLLTQLDDEKDRAAVRKLIEAIMRDVGNRMMTDLGVQVSFSLLTASAQQFMKEQTLSFVTHVDDTTRGLLRETLAEGIGAGETPMQLTRRVADVFVLRRNNAQTIAVTESGTAYNAAQLEAARQAHNHTGLHIVKEWLTSRDENVRGTPGKKRTESALFSHFTADRQRTELDEFFYVGSPFKSQGERGPMPGDEPCLMPEDPSLSAGNRINCRCVARYLVLAEDGDDDRRGTVTIEELLQS